MEKLLIRFPLPALRHLACIESIVENCYQMTGYKFSVIFNGSKGYLSNIQIRCEGTQEEENRIFVERESLRKANGIFVNVQVNVFHSEENGVRVSIGEDTPRPTCIVKTSGSMERRRVLLGQTVYHQKIYDGKEEMKVVGIRENEVELQGDYSGGTHNVSQKDWLPIEGLLFSKTKNLILNHDEK